VQWGHWWTIGIAMGWGVALGVFLTGLVGAGRNRLGIVAIIAAAAGVAIGILIWSWPEAVGGAVGAIAGTIAAAQIVGGALRRGGTRGGTAMLVTIAALALAAIALIPIAGYVEAALLPVIGLRVRRRQPERYAGLRTLARD
jgi:asparagine N-glycosylation enzyme membrane subunit Stt3